MEAPRSLLNAFLGDTGRTTFFEWPSISVRGSGGRYNNYLMNDSTALPPVEQLTRCRDLFQCGIAWEAARQKRNRVIQFIKGKRMTTTRVRRIEFAADEQIMRRLVAEVALVTASVAPHDIAARFV